MYFVLSHQKTVFRLYMFCIVQSENVNVIVHIYIVFTPSILFYSFSWDAKLWKRNRQVVEVLLNILSQRQYFLANETYADAVVKWFKSIENESWAVKKINIQDIKFATLLKYRIKSLSWALFSILKTYVIVLIGAHIF